MQSLFGKVPGYLWPLLILAALAVVAALLWRQPRVRRWVQAQRLNYLLRGLDRLRYVHLQTLELPSGRKAGPLAHVLVSPYGLFVLEVVELSGRIAGAEKLAQWTYGRTGTTQRLRNPLQKCQQQARRLAEFLGLTEQQVHSVVLFTGRCDFSGDMPPEVTQGQGAVAYIHRLLKTEFEPEQMQLLLDRLEPLQRGVTIEPPLVLPGELLQPAVVATAAVPVAATPAAPMEVPRSTEVRPESATTQRPVVAPRLAPAPLDAVDLLLEGRGHASAPVIAPTIAPVVQPASPDLFPPIAFPAPAQSRPELPRQAPASPVTPFVSAGPADSRVRSVDQEAAAARPAKPARSERARDDQPQPCPDCAGTLAPLQLRQGPMAGRVIWRCARGCGFVRLPDDAGAPG